MTNNSLGGPSSLRISTFLLIIRLIDAGWLGYEFYTKANSSNTCAGGPWQALYHFAVDTDSPSFTDFCWGPLGDDASCVVIYTKSGGGDPGLHAYSSPDVCPIDDVWLDLKGPYADGVYDGAMTTGMGNEAGPWNRIVWFSAREMPFTSLRVTYDADAPFTPVPQEELLTGTANPGPAMLENSGGYG